MERDVIFKRWITIRALPDARGELVAKSWYEALQLRDRRRADAGMITFDMTEQAGIRNTGRIEPVKGRRWLMLELKLTRGGATGPQLRMLGVQRGRTFFAATGFSKTTRRIPRNEITRAEQVLDEGLPDEPNEGALGRQRQKGRDD